MMEIQIVKDALKLVWVNDVALMRSENNFAGTLTK